MTALAAAKETRRQPGELIAIPLKDEAKLHKGAFVCHDATLGTLIPGADTANLRFAGVAADSVDNTGGTEAGKSCRVYKTGVFDAVYGAGGADNTLLGKEAELTDDQTVNLATGTTNHIKCGRICGIVSATVVRVMINGYC